MTRILSSLLLLFALSLQVSAQENQLIFEDLLETARDSGLVNSYWTDQFETHSKDSALHYRYGDLYASKVFHPNENAVVIEVYYQTYTSTEKQLFSFVNGEIVGNITIVKNADCDGNVCHWVEHKWLEKNEVEVTITDTNENNYKTIQTFKYRIKDDGRFVVMGRTHKGFNLNNE